ncbi:beta-N-acetylhexosaminidase [bacterium]|nr:beta-N-acetylhexosaminidase [bacterium]
MKCNPSDLFRTAGRAILLLAAVIVCLGLPTRYAIGAEPVSRTVATALRSRGYSLIPAPQRVDLEPGDIRLDRTWGIVSEAGEGTIAERRLKEAAAELHGLEFSGSGAGRIVLAIKPGTVTTAVDKACEEQAYRISLQPGRVEICGNAPAGLFYGVQSLLQLLRADNGQWRVPAGTITDWPSMRLRFIHWDTKHHQNRMETLKRQIDWAAFFKVNAIGFELEDKYEYPRHPVIGAPGAYTRAEMQELTRYALERYVQLVPQIQAPSHMAYVLKHPEFAHLRADNSNYHICMCDEEAMRLIFDMYQDMIDATPGVKYFHASTDEVYYAGSCPKCTRKRPYNDINRSLTWVEYVNRAFDWLKARDRRMLCWVEFPLLTEHISLLPRGLINAELVAERSDEWNRGLEKAGVEQLIYSSQQGEEYLFPNYFSSSFLYRGKPVTGRIGEPEALVNGVLDKGYKAIGTYAAAWDDSGLHDETFWLGWATVSQYGWSPAAPSTAQSVADFMDVFYGPGNSDMLSVYRTVMEGARVYQEAWDRVPATRLKPSYGLWTQKGRDTTRIDLTIEPPRLPFSYDMTLVVGDNFSRSYGPLIAQTAEMALRLQDLEIVLNDKLNTVNRNRYNIEVLLSLVRFEEYFCNTIQTLKKVEALFLEARGPMDRQEEARVLALLTQAHTLVADNLRERQVMWNGFQQTWEKSRFPKNRTVDGRVFFHELDDLKDHHADRRPGLDYLLEPLDNIGLEKWNRGLADYIRSFAVGSKLPVPEL